MIKKALAVILLVILGGLAGGVSFYALQRKYRPLQSSNPPPISRKIVEDGKDFSEVISSISPSVVNISTVRVMRRSDGAGEDHFFDLYDDLYDRIDPEAPKKWKEQGLGTGVIVSQDGYIVTNYHVISDAEQIKVTLFDKTTVKGKVVGIDPKTDIAVIKVDVNGLNAISFDDSDELRVGEYVLAIGNPFGLSHTVTLGIVSAVGRANVGIAEFEDFIQTDAAINPGNSGGPLVDTKGRLVGINTAIFSGSGGYQGIGFAVPSNMVKSLVEQIIKDGKVVRGWLGIFIQELTPELSAKFGYDKTTGALVDEVTRSGPSEKAGLKRGDIIVRFSGKDIDSPSALKTLVAKSKPGDDVQLDIIRFGKSLKTAVRVAEPPREAVRVTEIPEPHLLKQNPFAGLYVADITKDVAKQLSLEAGEQAVVVVRVQPASPSEDAGLRRGDLIYEVDSKPIKNTAEFSRAVNQNRLDEPVLLYIGRAGRKLFLTIIPSD